MWPFSSSWMHRKWIQFNLTDVPHPILRIRHRGDNKEKLSNDRFNAFRVASASVLSTCGNPKTAMRLIKFGGINVFDCSKNITVGFVFWHGPIERLRQRTWNGMIANGKVGIERSKARTKLCFGNILRFYFCSSINTILYVCYVIPAS